MKFIIIISAYRGNVGYVRPFLDPGMVGASSTGLPLIGYLNRCLVVNEFRKDNTYPTS